MALPSMAYADGIRKRQTVTFGGYDHNIGSQDGAIWDMANMTSDYYPVLASRPARHRVRTLSDCGGLFAHDGLFWTDGDGFYKDGVRKGTVTPGEKVMAALGPSVIVFPDKVYYNNATDKFGSLEASVTASVTIKDGTYAGEDAAANTISGSVVWSDHFAVGDAVTISGAAAHPANNKTSIIREIEGNELRFYENVFEIGNGGDKETLTLKREVPDMDFICSNENRLWGCKGDTIYASKLGDATNFNVFDGVATDSFAVDVGSAGDFTACVSYLGYPVFFKEDSICKVYGSKPSNFQVMTSATLGVEAGSHRSPAVAGEVLFYLSRAGIVSYAGGIPQSISRPFGVERYRNAVGGSDGVKYYVSMSDADGVYALFVYDTRYNIWHKEDGLKSAGFAWDGELYAADAESGALWILGNPRTVPDGAVSEGDVASSVEFADFVEGDANRKGTSKLQLRGELEGTLKVEMQFDSDGVWRPVSELKASVKRSWYLPIIPRRSDHFRIRLTGTGDWRLFSLVRENYSGSEL